MHNPIKIRTLSDDERRMIYEGALRILAEVGAKVEDPGLFRGLRHFGCVVDEDVAIVKVPAEVVEKAVELCDKRPCMKCPNGKTLRFEGDNRYYGSLVNDPFVLDYDEGPRAPRLEDVARNARLGDALPRVDMIYKMDLSYADLDDRVADLKSIQAFVANTTTSYFCAPSSPDATRNWVDIAEIMAGGSLFENPILGGYVPIISPLYVAKENSDQLRLFCERGVVLRCGPCAMAGATAPFTVAGVVTQGVAESLFQLCLSQSIKPGVAVIMASGGSVMHMKTGHDVYGGPVKDLICMGAQEMVDYLGLPSLFGVFSTLTRNCDVQNGIESAFSALFPFFLKNHVMIGMGSLGNACGMSSEQILIHDDILACLERYGRGITVTEETIGVNSVAATGPQGDFLADALTLKHLRSDEHWLSDFDDIYNPSSPGGPPMLDKVHARVEELLASHSPEVDEARLEEVDRYVAEKVGEIL